MDYETKIYLDKVIEAVEKLDNTDWWMFSTTVFVGLIAAFITHKLGKRQNKLQEQQVKLQEQQNRLQDIQTQLMVQQAKMQEYDQYKELYLLIRAIHYKAKHAVSNLTSTIGWSISDERCIETLKSRRKEVYELRNRLSECEVDFGLKTDMTNLQYATYYLALIYVETLIEQVIDYLEIGEITRPESISRETNSDNGHIETLLSWTNYSVRDDMRKTINDVVHMTNNISEYNVLQSLEKHCKF